MGISLAELLRRSLRTMIPADGANLWMRYAGMVESGDPRSSRNIDDLVYGQKGLTLTSIHRHLSLSSIARTHTTPSFAGYFRDRLR
ncbi:MAG: hypothetical protein ACREXS_20420 [Gammaproteobacteria bacterium]